MTTAHQHTEGTLTLTGEGQVQAKPDIATINLGVVTEARTAQAAVAQNAERMTQVLDRIKALGLPAEDLQTTGFNISPVVDFEEHSSTFGTIIRYRVEDTLRIKAPVAQAGKILDEGIAAGANVAGQLSFGLREETAYRHRALQAAVKSARADAEFLAHEMGATLRGATSAELLFGGSPIIARGFLAAERATTPIEPGTLTISARVRMVYKYEKKTGKSKR
jgi:uncharacterized protein YggE